jgi:hypothetical protein
MPIRNGKSPEELALSGLQTSLRFDGSRHF